MQERLLDAETFSRAVCSGLALLAQHKEQINCLNVFPVPDGDTGTNMYLTMESAVKEIDSTSYKSIDQLAHVLAEGALMGARGNSGVILSQMFRGFAAEVQGKKVLEPKDLADALQNSVTLAYKSVIKPVEGTILTVAKALAEGARESLTQSSTILSVLEGAIWKAKIVLAQTPELLPALAKAGVVDAGGQGLVTLWEGIYKDLAGEDSIILPLQEKELVFASPQSTIVLDFPYCTEFIIKGKEIPQDQVKQYLQRFGESLLVVGSDEIVKVHVHTANPGQVLDYALQFGSLHRIKVNNMEDQHHQVSAREKSVPGAPETAVVAIAAGQGLAEILKSLGADRVVAGGQSMNPSTQDIVSAIEAVQAGNIIILPNNKNVIMAAEQAAQLVAKNVIVIPTRSFPEGMAALLAFDKDQPLEANRTKMAAAFQKVPTGEVTFAVRDAEIQGHSISAGDILGLVNGEIVAVGKQLIEVSLPVADAIICKEHELLTVFYGEEVSQQDAEQLLQVIENRYPDMAVELYYGGQPLYHYILTAE